MRPRRLEEGDALVLRALEIIATLGGRYLLQVRDSVQEADPTVDQHALCRSGSRCDAWEDGASEGRSRGASTHGGSA